MCVLPQLEILDISNEAGRNLEEGEEECLDCVEHLREKDREDNDERSKSDSLHHKSLHEEGVSCRHRPDARDSYLSHFPPAPEALEKNRGKAPSARE